MNSDITSLFVNHSVSKLRQMSGFIESCVARLSDEQIWSRSAPHENSIGNLILHVCGNAQQWIRSGVGGQTDVRDRDSEFSATGGMAAAELVSHMNKTVDEAISIITAVTPERLCEEVHPQGKTVSVLDAIYQVVGHFQQHAGQIIFATKICTGEDLALQRPGPKSEKKA